jgi:hypothetical protein
MAAAHGSPCARAPNNKGDSALAEDLLGYEQLTQDAMRGVVRAALQRAAGPRGLPGQHHFYITFRTKAAGVSIPEHMYTRYPDEMTIVLEHRFRDLEVFNDYFRVVLTFSGVPHAVIVPFAALTRFYDPSVRFGLQFEPPGADAPAPEIAEPAPAEAAPAAAQASAGIVSLDAFRKK